MEQRLRGLRSIGRQPQVLVLEEAFTARAQAIGRNSGYRSVVLGSPARGLFGSGLEIATDLPVLDAKRFSYSACAGFDCLARKGVLLVTVMLPRGVPIQVAATHLNSHRASGTDDHDANAAYYRQVDLLSRFIAANRNLRLPLVVAGDFNTFPAVRRDYLSRESRSWPAADSLERLTAVASSAVGSLLRSAKDREFYASGATARIAPVGIAVPFGREADGSMLSNHVGFAIDYRVDRFSRSPRLGNS